MPRIVDYSKVIDLLTQQGFKSLYYNSGAFGFGPGVKTVSRGWIGDPDPSIRESALPMVRQIPEPVVPRLAALLIQMWQQHLPGFLWAMPKSHWAFELEFGSKGWMPTALNEIGVDWQTLVSLNNAPAIEFELDESKLVESFVAKLLANLSQSDFQIVFPGRQTLCTVHSRKQLWWTTLEPVIAAGLDHVLQIEQSENINDRS